MTGLSLTDGKFQGIGTDGKVVGLGSLEITHSATGLAAETYRDSSKTSTNTYPILLSASGKADVYLTDGTYDIVLKDQYGEVIWSVEKYISNLSDVYKKSETYSQEEIDALPSIVNSQWTIPAFITTYVSSNSFKIIADKTSIFLMGRKLRINLAASSVYSEVLSSSYDAALDITTVTTKDAVVTSTLSSVDYSILTPSSSGGGSSPYIAGVNNIVVSNVSDLSNINVSEYTTAIVKDTVRGGLFFYDSTLAAINNGGTIFNGWVRQYSGAVNVKWFGAVGDGTVDDTDAIQTAFNCLSTNSKLEFTGLKTCMIRECLSFMRSYDWRNGYTSDDRSNIEIDFGTTEIKFLNTVAFQAIQPNQPIYIRGPIEMTTKTMQPNMLMLSIDNLTIRGGIFNANMQARGANLGLPGQLEQEACICLVGCYNPIVKDVVTKDSMGDGITFTGAYNTTDGTGSQFKYINSVEAECRNITVDNTKHYRHSRLGISLIVVKGGTVNNTYAEEIDSVTDYRSVAGPGSTIDCEANVSNSWQRCEDITITNIQGKNNTYGGLIQLQQCKNIHINGGTYLGEHNISVLRSSGAVDCTIRNVHIDTQDLSSGAYFRLGGARVTFSDITILNGSSYALLLPDTAGGTDCSLLNVECKNYHSTDSTGSLLELNNYNGITIKNISFDLTDNSTMLHPIYMSGTQTNIEIDGFTIKCDESQASIGAKGIVDYASTVINSAAKFNNFNIQGKSVALVSGADITNTLEFTNSTIQQAIHFPSALAIKSQIYDNIKVESAWGDGSTSTALLYIKAIDDTSIEIKNCEVISNGKYGYNKPYNGAYFICPVDTFADLTTFKCKLDNLTFTGGREGDGLFTTTHNNASGDDGSILSSPGIDSFQTTNIKINKQIGFYFTVPSGSDSANVINPDNSSFLPNQLITIMRVGGGAAENYFIKEYQHSGGPSIGSFIVFFSATTTTDQMFRIV